MADYKSQLPDVSFGYNVHESGLGILCPNPKATSKIKEKLVFG